jgi:hypothetical protein
MPGGLDSADTDAIGESVSWCVQTMNVVAEEILGIALPRLEIWTLDLTEALTHLAPRVTGQPVDPADVERVGGQVAAKTMPLEDDWSSAAVVSPGVDLASGDEAAKALALFTLLHEIAHTLIERLGTLSGVREIGWHPTVHSLRKARNAVRHGLDEWRASTLASAALGTAVTDATGQPISVPTLMGATYRSHLGAVLDQVYPGWPDGVTRYRSGQASLESLYAQIS